MGRKLGQMIKDNGCSEHDDCFTCPFPDCIMRSNNSKGVSKTQLRREKIMRMSKHFSTSQIATYFSIDKRTVQMALKGAVNE